MKRGLSLQRQRSRGHTSAMPLAAHEGIGHMSGTCSISERNQLALRMGDAGGRDHSDRFPGGARRVVLRRRPRALAPRRHPRQRGALGGLGVYTRAALKIYHWAGPPTMEVKGYSPDYVCQEPGELPVPLPLLARRGRAPGRHAEAGRERDRLRHHGLQPQHGGGQRGDQQRGGAGARRDSTPRRSSAPASVSSLRATRLATSSTRRRCSSRSSKTPRRPR